MKRLAAALLAAGRTEVAVPVRRCAAGRHAVRDNWSATQGCVRCDTGHALADCVRLVTGLLDGLPGDQARGCLLAAAGGGSSRNTAARLRVIAAHLRADPGALASGGTAVPVDVLRNATGHIAVLLTALGALPPRDTHLACLERDIAAILDSAADQDMRRLLHRYATWGLLRHARTKARQAPLTSGIRHGQAARLNTAVHFTSWLANRGLDLAACRQPDLDTYLLARPARRDEVRHFLAWARRYRDRALTIPPAPRPDTTVPLAQDHRWALARSLLHDGGHDPGDRVAGLLVLLFGQRPGRIARLTTSHISLDAAHTTLTLGTTPISIPEPLASHLHDLTRHRRHLSQVPASGPGPWLFPGMHPGQPVLPATISHHRLARIGVNTVTGRASALLQRAGELPPTVVADLLGLRPKTAIAWGQLAGRPWAAYPALRDQRP